MNEQQDVLGQDTHTMEVRYQRAQAIIQGYLTKSLVQNDTILPTWIEGTECFWYERTYQAGKESSRQVYKEYRLVNAKAATNRAAFNHREFADALSQSSGQAINKEDLPIERISITLFPLTVRFTAFERRWQFDEEHKSCEEILSDLVADNEVLSPNGKWLGFSRDNNLWIKDVVKGEEQALTHDGEEDYAYGVGSTAYGAPLLPEVPALWSPDSSRLLTVQRDKRKVKTLSKINHVPPGGSVHPTLEQVKVGYPGDQHVETFELLIIDICSGKVRAANYRPMPVCVSDYHCGFFNQIIWWAKDSRRAWFVDQERGNQRVCLVELDTDTGVTKVLFEEVSDTCINTATDVSGFALHRFLPGSNELIWWSERSGWGHLYLYDLDTGDLKHVITSGDWRVRDVLHVDESRRELFIQTSARVQGRDPYYRDICRLNIDTGEMVTLFSRDEETIVHYQKTWAIRVAKLAGCANAQTVGVSPSGNYLVTTRSRADHVPVSLLMDRNGKVILELEIADISNLPAGWHWPEPVQLLAADGKTDIYGLLFRPSDFSPEQRYPVLNYIVSAPWLSVVPKGSFHNARGYADRHYFYGAALAELGFIVTLIDSRGTPLRNKAFLDESYGWIPSSANTADHIGALQQLAALYPFMDMDRVGVFTNGYRSGLQSFLECQSVYKLCVALSLLDSRLAGALEADPYEGCEGPVEGVCYPEDLVDKLEGKLLLMNAMSSVLSAYYPSTATFRVIDALQRANKDFDMLIVSDGGLMYTAYMMRRTWDYLVRHLQGLEPPKEFNLEEVPL